MKVGYARISTQDQNASRQIAALKEAGAEKIFEDHTSGKNIERTGLKEMLVFLREEDELIVVSLDRLARNLSDLLELVNNLVGRGVSLMFLKEGLHFRAGKQSTATDKLILSIVGAFAEFERELIKARQKEGIELARLRGIYTGRKRSITDQQIEQIKRMIEQGIPLALAARKNGISRSSAYKYLKRSKSTD